MLADRPATSSRRRRAGSDPVARRLLAIVALCVVPAAAVACQGTTSTTTSPGSSTPSSSTPPTSTSTTWPVGEQDCGTVRLAGGWPTTTMPVPAAFDCILGAFVAGTPAHFVEREQTDGEGGHIRSTAYEVTGVRSVRRVVDPTGAAPPAGIESSVCTELTLEPGRSTLTAGSCTPG